MGRKHGFSFSWKRATGLSGAKGRISRQIGIPLTRSGRQRKFGKWGLGSLFSSSKSKRQSVPTGRGTCPKCGVAFNVRASSIGTVRRCQACGYKFILERAPRSSGCLRGLLVLMGLGVLIFVLFQIPWNYDKDNTVEPAPQVTGNATKSTLVPTPTPTLDAPTKAKSRLVALQESRKTCLANLKKTLPYIDAEADAKVKLAHLDDARNAGDTDEITKSSQDYEQVLLTIKQLEDNAYDTDPGVRTAEKEFRDSATTNP